MENSFFFSKVEKTADNAQFLESISDWATSSHSQTYLVEGPLSDSKYTYSHKGAFLFLSAKRKIAFVDFSGNKASFEEYIDEVIEDLGTISDKYRYRDIIGRPRLWRPNLVTEIQADSKTTIDDLLRATVIEDQQNQRLSELLLSLLTGSVNDIARVKLDVPETLLEKIKRKIVLFDGEQTRFIYQKMNQKVLRIQGLSGTGKTELLMHKLKELYISDDVSRILVTCHNRILADSLRGRVPNFFNFMKVEQQIKWNERLWCVHAWGSGGNIHSGAYRYICEFYNLPFNRFSPSMSFDRACTLALQSLQGKPIEKFAFDFVLADESQDLPESFIKLCEAVTKSAVVVAGDIFQSIFDDTITKTISPDFLLNKCYRTDPRTLMFAHALGMGLFEPEKLRWLEDDEWDKCGYIVEKAKDANNRERYRLSREPLRRFEDVANDEIASVVLCDTGQNFLEGAVERVVEIVKQIKEDHSSVVPDDIAIILVDDNNRMYAIADQLEQVIPRAVGWRVNKAHETKQKIADMLFISNRNNVKGLEFPFVICLTNSISRRYRYRNALYMSLTRSFLQSYIVTSGKENAALFSQIVPGLEKINDLGFIETIAPTSGEKSKISTSIKSIEPKKSFYDCAQDIFDDLEVPPLFRKNILDASKKIFEDEYDSDSLRDFITVSFSSIKNRRSNEE
jgi:superfamily I DNA and RNA helicase